MHWNRHALRLRPIVADDWTNPQRPKPDLMAQELELLIRHAQAEKNRLTSSTAEALRNWYDLTHAAMATYEPGVDKPQDFFERALLRKSMEKTSSMPWLGTDSRRMKLPRLSIITAVHAPNSAHLADTIMSVQRQKLPPEWSLEWIIQEDGEQPQLASLFEDVEVAHYSPNGFQLGIAATRNFALARATGDLIQVF